MDGRSTEGESSFECYRCFEISPCRGLQIKAFISPTHAQVLIAGIFAYRIPEFDLFAPIHLLIAYWHYNIRMHAIGLDINSHFLRRILLPTNGYSGKAPCRKEVEQNESDNAKQAYACVFEELFQREVFDINTQKQ